MPALPVTDSTCVFPYGIALRLYSSVPFLDPPPLHTDSFLFTYNSLRTPCELGCSLRETGFQKVTTAVATRWDPAPVRWRGVGINTFLVLFGWCLAVWSVWYNGGEGIVRPEKSIVKTQRVISRPLRICIVLCCIICIIADQKVELFTF